MGKKKTQYVHSTLSGTEFALLFQNSEMWGVTVWKYWPQTNETQQRQHQRLVSSVKDCRQLDFTLSSFLPFTLWNVPLSVFLSSSSPLSFLASVLAQNFPCQMLYCFSNTNQGLCWNPRFCNKENHPSGLSHRKSTCPLLDGFCYSLKHQRKNPETSFLLHPPCI